MLKIKTNKKKVHNGMIIGFLVLAILTIIILGMNALFKIIEKESLITSKQAKLFWIELVETHETAQISIVREVQAKEKKLTIKEWVKQEIESAGLNWEEVDCLIFNESAWNNWRYNINTNGTTDMGLWMINSIHKKTASVECRWDYKCSTEWAIKKRLNDGNWNAWYGYDKCK